MTNAQKAAMVADARLRDHVNNSGWEEKEQEAQAATKRRRPTVLRVASRRRSSRARMAREPVQRNHPLNRRSQKNRRRSN